MGQHTLFLEVKDGRSTLILKPTPSSTYPDQVAKGQHDLNLQIPSHLLLLYETNYFCLSNIN